MGILARSRKVCQTEKQPFFRELDERNLTPEWRRGNLCLRDATATCADLNPVKPIGTSRSRKTSFFVPVGATSRREKTASPLNSTQHLIRGLHMSTGTPQEFSREASNRMTVNSWSCQTYLYFMGLGVRWSHFSHLGSLH